VSHHHNIAPPLYCVHPEFSRRLRWWCWQAQLCLSDMFLSTCSIRKLWLLCPLIPACHVPWLIWLRNGEELPGTHCCCLGVPLSTVRRIIKNKWKEEKKDLFLRVSGFPGWPFPVQTVYIQISRYLLTTSSVIRGTFSSPLAQFPCLPLSSFSNSLYKNNYFLGFLESTHSFIAITS
jgi:hypothetical protein